MVGLRNLIAHGYDDDITLSRLWGYMQLDVPELLVQIDDLLVEYFDEFGSDADVGAKERQ